MQVSYQTCTNVFYPWNLRAEEPPAILDNRKNPQNPQNTTKTPNRTAILHISNSAAATEEKNPFHLVSLPKHTSSKNHSKPHYQRWQLHPKILSRTAGESYMKLGRWIYQQRPVRLSKMAVGIINDGK
jgi:hypothetical protein